MADFLEREEAKTMLYEDLRRCCKVSSSICNRVGWYFQIFSRHRHGCNDFHETAGCDESQHANLGRANDKCMRPAERKKHTFSWSNLENLAANVCLQCPLQHIEEFVFPCVNMRRRLGPAFHVGEYKIESSTCVFVCCQLSTQDAFVPGGRIYGRRMFEWFQTDN